MKNDIRDAEDVRRLVDRFYERAAFDSLLGDIFSHISEAEGVRHQLYDYWSATLLHNATTGFPRHIEHLFTRRHFVRWQNLFLDAIDDEFSGANADRAKVIVIRKSEEFQSQLEISRF